MKKEWQNVIDEILGTPIKINSSLVSAQNRNRLYWTNIKNISQPKDKGIFISDIIDFNEENYRYYTDEQMSKWFNKEYVRKDYYRIESLDGKCQCLMAQCGSNAPRIWHNNRLRYLTPIEWERLQTVPDNYTKGVSEAQRKKALGNGWTVDVIAHIFGFIKQQ